MAKEREEKKAKLEAEGKLPAKKGAGKASAAADEDDEDLDPNQYYERRVAAVTAAKARGDNPYPHKFQVRGSLVGGVRVRVGGACGA